MEEKEPFIPIDDQLNNFNNLLKDHNRLFFSARFGDGKTTFLNEFKGLKQDEYQFITLFPINYQIVDNKDIFELIKRDILLQLFMLDGIVLNSNDVKIAKQLCCYFKNNYTDLAEDLLLSFSQIFSNITLSPEMQEPIKRVFKNINKFKSQQKAKEDKTNELKITDNFLDKSNILIYEFDAISQLIYTLIKQYREKKKKEIVLIIEDLDRIDPKHLFRLLNIFSAHLDRINKGLSELDCNLSDNKFGFDKIVFVCDYYNIEKIFHHFYGKETDFKGYISKFCSAQPFRYSLKESFFNYIMSIIPETISKYVIISNILSEMIINKYSHKDILDIDNESLRTIKENIILPPRIIPQKYIYNKKDPKIRVPAINNFTILIDLLNRFNFTFNDFMSIINKKKQKDKIINFISECWSLSDYVHSYNISGFMYFKTENSAMISYQININNTSNNEDIFYKTCINSVVSRINESKIFYDNNITITL